MTRFGRWVSAGAAAGLAVALAAAGAFAQSANEAPPERPLSVLHSAYGPSQLLVGDSTSFRNVHIRLSNPTIREHMVAVLAYERVIEGRSGEAGGGEAEVFNNCTVKRLTPHGSVSSSSLFTSGPFYGEVISAPSQPIRLPNGSVTRVANGLGVLAKGGGSRENQRWQPVFPRLFSLPSNAVVPGQREQAIRCVCLHLRFLFEDVPGDVFSDFGITCSQ